MTYQRTFVTMENIDEIRERLIGLVGDRRMTKTHRYIGAGSVTVQAGLTLDKDAREKVRTWDQTRPVGKGVSFNLAPGLASFGVAAYERENDTVAQAQERYAKIGEGERIYLEVTLLETQGWPGEPRRDDMIRIEYWNEHGVGQEIVIVFDDVTPVHQIGDPLVGHYFECSWCTTHNEHYEDPEHEYRYADRTYPVSSLATHPVKVKACSLRSSTQVEDLRILAVLAETAEKKESSDV